MKIVAIDKRTGETITREANEKQIYEILRDGFIVLKIE